MKYSSAAVVRAGLTVIAVSLLAPKSLTGQGLQDSNPRRPTELSDHHRAMLDDASLNDVMFVDAQRGWAVGERGVIWHTADGGANWRLQSSGVKCRLAAVHFIDDQTGWAAGGNIHPYTHATSGVVLRTVNGGRSWSL